MNNEKYKIAIHAYGGTIAQIKDSKGYLRAPEDVSQFKATCLSALSSLQETIDFSFFNPFLIDSADATPLHWQQIASDLFKVQFEVDAQIILFGTDTLAYLANAIQLISADYLFQPTLITGAQQPLCEAGSDGFINLIDSVKAAVHLVDHSRKGRHFFGGLVTFGNLFINASRVSKVSARKSRGFDAPMVHDDSDMLKFKPGVIGKSEPNGVRIDLSLCDERQLLNDIEYQERIRRIVKIKDSSTSLPLNRFITNAPKQFFVPKAGHIGIDIVSIDFNPDSNPHQLYSIIENQQATLLFIRGVGDGHIGKNWLEPIRYANECGLAVFVQSPFFDGKAGISPYGTASDAEDVGVIPTFGMTRSMLYIKSSWLLATQQVDNYKSFCQALLSNSVDEVLLSIDQIEKIELLLDKVESLRKTDRIQSNASLITSAQSTWTEHLGNDKVKEALGFT